jgi:dTDP-glucose 4,6-dehydratase
MFARSIYEQLGCAIIFSKADSVIHAAALKHVSVLEEQPREAYLTNLIGTANVLKALETTNIEDFLFVSTDKATNPQGVLGKTKLLGERMTYFAQNYFGKEHIHFSAVRFGNVFLSRGSVLETYISAARRGEKLNVHDKQMTRYFMDLEDAANIILTVMSLRRDKIGILKMGEPIKILDLAEKVIQTLGSTSEIQEVGMKPGEKIHESLVSQEANSHFLDYENFSLYYFEHHF